MAPVRRYLRISKYSVLECRIYLDNPALAQSWLLNPRNPILPKVIESIRPLVLPKLREERERIKKKSKKKTVKDVIVTDEFEVSIFLTETSTRHSLIYRTKHFRDKLPPKLESNSSKLIGETDSIPMDVDDEYHAPVLQEEDEEDVRLSDIPVAETTTRRSKRQRGMLDPGQDGSEVSEDDETTSAIEIDSDTEAPPHKRPRARENDGLDASDDKKKLAMDVSYEGFAIYGQVLCLVVKKRASATTTSNSNSGGAKSRPEGQAMMENWISSTQVPVDEDMA
ncbi:hypothetical protein SNK03_000801 [Fusarium graminearum]|uniref:Chromosome 1, complete genome n=2 Tax=Gibberella zeae TaxID=5518 RepID=I1RAZ4_GIBZE|nr:hypothetical protein FGSG_00691 [Fusarium graminearum PH-1]EYB33519.1 hypothetical protein FG05_00691 [Fusarium graminearum]ESU05906.1 hypothetical protein FGSG_00691 [Fusarium graminearum PH-1]KAI6761508.1 hypothetical protein HG531_002061 [Fusarium graminearum]CAF3448661.1 unnamed protein product [Fusarium graminearum]CAF3582765.1 unnamed protein product [Fusarium graminearum]|eukprot:XP_011316391.1 hypothetical protein FGSG_00691 [Fusarium graminearum PH-1]